MKGRNESNIYLTTYSTHFIYGYMVKGNSDSERCNPLPLFFRLTARVILHVSSNIQDNTCHSICYPSLEELAGTTNSSPMNHYLYLSIHVGVLLVCLALNHMYLV